MGKKRDFCLKSVLFFQVFASFLFEKAEKKLCKNWNKIVKNVAYFPRFKHLYNLGGEGPRHFSARRYLALYPFFCIVHVTLLPLLLKNLINFEIISSLGGNLTSLPATLTQWKYFFFEEASAIKKLGKVKNLLKII